MPQIFDADQCPEDIRIALAHYVVHGRRVGGFLTAVLENNLLKALTRADDTNFKKIGAIVAYVANRIPQACWGDSATYLGWVGGAYEKLHGDPSLKPHVLIISAANLE